MTITPFGVLYLSMLAVVFARRAAWLLPMLVFAAMLHSPAVFVLRLGDAAMGASPWLVTAAVIAVDLLRIVLRNGGLHPRRDSLMWKLFLGWSVFLGLAAVSAFVLPWIFAGMSTYNAENLHSLWDGPEPLQWRPVNAVHAINAVVAWVLLLYATQASRDAGFERRMGIAFATAGAFALLASLAQRLLLENGIDHPAWVVASNNPSYLQTVGQTLGGILRMNWPFSEPSYSSVWFASIYAAGLALFVFTTRAAIGLAGAACGIIGMANTLGGSGLASAFLWTLVVLAVATVQLVARPDARRRLQRRLACVLAGAALAASAGATIHKIDGFEKWTARNLYDWVVLPRVLDHTLATPSRADSNRLAVTVLRDTGGLGVGFGSNRASSYAFNLASNVGILPALLFAALILVQMRAAFRGAAARPVPLAFATACIAALIGVVAGIPDLMWPGLWIWIIASLGMIDAAAERGPPAVPSSPAT